MPKEMSGVNFTDTSFGKTMDASSRVFNDCNFTRAWLSGVDFSNSIISGNLTNANLSGANLINADLSSADLTRVYLKNAITDGVRWPSSGKPPDFVKPEEGSLCVFQSEPRLDEPLDIRNKVWTDTVLGSLEFEGAEAGLARAFSYLMADENTLYTLVRLQESVPLHAHLIYGLRISDEELVILTVDNEVAINGIYVDATLLINTRSETAEVIDSYEQGLPGPLDIVADLATDLDVAIRCDPGDYSLLQTRKGHILVAQSLGPTTDGATPSRGVTILKDSNSHSFFPAVPGLLRGNSLAETSQKVADALPTLTGVLAERTCE